MKLRTIGTALLLLSLPSAAQRATNVDALITMLKDPKTSEDAKKQLLEVGESNLNIQHRLAEFLPEALKDRSDLPVWQNEVELAGQLKILTTIPMLSKLLTQTSEVGGLTDLYREAQLVDDPVAKALSRIGDPAVPSLKTILNSANVETRWRATRILLLIGTPLAQQTLQDRLLVEKDPTMRLRIEDNLKRITKPGSSPTPDPMRIPNG
jgi:DNA-binding phage protein